jgi:hypothetical protein
MSHPTVGQLELLSALTKKYFDITQPRSSMFLGVAGGNGLEQIDPVITKELIGIDINQHYLDTTVRRFQTRFDSFRTINLDITDNSNITINKVELVWAALIVEYVGIENALTFSRNNLSDNGHLVITTQSNRGAKSVSPTGVESVKSLGPIFQSVDSDVLCQKAAVMDFTLVNKEENELPNGKSFFTFQFRLK